MAFSDDGFLELLYCVNLVIGITLVSVGGGYYSTINKYNDLTAENLNILPTLVIISGVVVITLILFAICVLYFTNEVEIIRTISLIIFPALIIMQMTIGIYGCILARDSNGEMLTGFQKEMRSDFLKNEVNKNYSDSLNVLQENFQCCGVYGPDDYSPNSKLPSSCCENVKNEFCEKRRLRYPIGCAEKVYEKVTRSIAVTSNVALGVSIIQVAGLICLGKLCCDNKY